MPQNPNNQPTELFEMELIVCIRMDMRWIAYKGWYAIKYNQPIN